MHSIRTIRYDKYYFQPITSNSVRLRNVIDLNVSIRGIETKMQFFVISDKAVGNIGFTALLGLPYFYAISGVYDLSDISIIITDLVSKVKVRL
jgi:hypothetical protein